MNYLRQIRAIFKDFSHNPTSRSLNLRKKGLESPGKVLEFHLHQRVDTLWQESNARRGDKRHLHLPLIPIRLIPLLHALIITCDQAFLGVTLIMKLISLVLFSET